MKLASLVCALSLLFPITAHPEGDFTARSDVKTLLEHYDAGTPADKLFILAVASATADGIGWANAALEARKQTLLYCPPPELSLTAGQELAMLREHVTNDPSLAGYPYVAAMIVTFQEVFPCP
jgi:hypothetical protein